MRAAIVVDDSAVYVDGEGIIVDLAELKSTNYHAIQWYDTFGEAEYRKVWLEQEKRWHQQPNQHITSFAPFQKFYDEAKTKKTALDEERARMKAEHDAMMVKVEVEKKRLTAFFEWIAANPGKRPPLELQFPPEMLEKMPPEDKERLIQEQERSMQEP